MKDINSSRYNWHIDLSGNIINDALILELLMYPNVLITAHQGFFTVEALTQIAQTTLANIDNFFRNKTINEVGASQETAI